MQGAGGAAHHHHRLPSAGKRYGGADSPHAEDSLVCQRGPRGLEGPPIVGPLGHAGSLQGGDGDLGGGGGSSAAAGGARTAAAAQ